MAVIGWPAAEDRVDQTAPGGCPRFDIRRADESARSTRDRESDADLPPVESRELRCSLHHSQIARSIRERRQAERDAPRRVGRYINAGGGGRAAHDFHDVWRRTTGRLHG